MPLSLLRRYSIDRTLPVLSSGLVVATVLALSTVAYLRLEHGLVASTRSRLDASAKVVSSLLSAMPSRLENGLLRNAGDPVLRGFFRGTTSRDSALAFLGNTARGGDTVLRSIALLDTNGTIRLVLNFHGKTGFSTWVPSAIRAGEMRKRASTTGPFEAFGQQVVSTATVPIRSDASSRSPILGYLVETRDVVSTGHHAIEQLVGSHVVLLVGQPGAGVWTDLERIHASPFTPHQSPPEDGVYHTSWMGKMVGATAPVAGTSWIVWVGQAEAEVGAPARAFLWETLPIGLTIMLLGAAFAWVYSRRITRPLVALTTSVEAIALIDGEPDETHDQLRGDEIRRLSESFNRLAARLERRKALQEQLLQAQKMEVIGRLAAGIVHDFNNLLTVIQTYTEMVLEETPAFDRRHADLREVQNAARRATVLTRQLLGFSRKHMPQADVVNSGAVLLSMDAMLKTLVGEGAELQLTVQEDLWHVLMDVGQLEQVIANLAVNARDAMADHGLLHIDATNVHLAESVVTRFSAAMPGDYVALGVRDNGAGMSAETQQRVFEPFFTTKAVGKGTGLGMATVYRIVEEAGGHILVDSEEGIGTAITVLFPRTDVKSLHAVDTGPVVKPGASILLVVSEEMRELWCRVLKRAGYRVLEARSAEHAVWLAQQNADAVRVIVTDVVLPETSGVDLVERLAAVCPTARALYVAGLTEDDTVREALSISGAVVLQKPFTGDDLARRVRSLVA